MIHTMYYDTDNGMGLVAGTAARMWFPTQDPAVSAPSGLNPQEGGWVADWVNRYCY